MLCTTLGVSSKYHFTIPNYVKFLFSLNKFPLPYKSVGN